MKIIDIVNVSSIARINYEVKMKQGHNFYKRMREVGVLTAESIKRRFAFITDNTVFFTQFVYPFQDLYDVISLKFTIGFAIVHCCSKRFYLIYLIYDFVWSFRFSCPALRE